MKNRSFQRFAFSSSFVVATFAIAQTAGAQVVRGRVTEVSSSAPIAGALVSLLGEATDSSIVSALTAASGEYAIRAPAPGRYRVSVKRIGVRRQVSSVFDLGAGETRVLDVPVDPIAQSLPQVTVSALCVSRASERARVSSLWDEVRTALEATQISQHDRLMQASVTRYAADLHPTNLHVLYDWHTEATLLVEQPFTSMSGDSLSDLGYWREMGKDSVQFKAPDSRALSSNAFLRDHCFSLAPPSKDRPDVVGLAFSPVRGRKTPDIIGTIWIDAARFELQSVEFRYSRLPDKLHRLWCRCAWPLPPEGVGGEVHFSRLSSGAWFVHRWFLRLPQLITEKNQTGNFGIMGGFGGTRRQLREAGGAVSAEGVSLSQPPVTITGVVRDSAGQPVADALIRAVGTTRQARTGADGSYRLDSLPAGGFSIVARIADMDSLGLLAGSQRVKMAAGDSARVEFQTANTAALRTLSCPMTDVPYPYRPVGRGVLRVLMLDSANSEPLVGVRLIASWPGLSESPVAKPGSLRTREAVTDSRGVASFCDLAVGIPLELAMNRADSLDQHLITFEASRTGIVRRVIRFSPSP